MNRKLLNSAQLERLIIKGLRPYQSNLPIVPSPNGLKETYLLYWLFYKAEELYLNSYKETKS
jgi:hypothetical protein